MASIFQNPTKSLPKQSDPQIVRVAMDENQLGGRKDHIPTPMASTHSGMTIEHVKNR